MTMEKNYSRHWAYKVPVSKSYNSYNRSRLTPVAAVYIKAAVSISDIRAGLGRLGGLVGEVACGSARLQGHISAGVPHQSLLGEQELRRGNRQDQICLRYQSGSRNGTGFEIQFHCW
ncbi:hypothetical protein E2C01_075159 [Portunus trituberculatus]|uniref:Uncharacterized protein n=1 Tax=Portunus trituberculatus TaxID=210409 RepID=A0A5B7IGC3_PORTR|nr:hypothetical protein [Portunus trituberculatus]